jgi:hypothetical protein
MKSVSEEGVEARRKPEFSLATINKLTLNVTAPVPCTCGGVIYQVGLKKGSCSRCSNPKAL